MTTVMNVSKTDAMGIETMEIMTSLVRPTEGSPLRMQNSSEIKPMKADARRLTVRAEETLFRTSLAVGFPK